MAPTDIGAILGKIHIMNKDIKVNVQFSTDESKHRMAVGFKGSLTAH